MVWKITDYTASSPANGYGNSPFSRKNIALLLQYAMENPSQPALQSTPLPAFQAKRKAAAPLQDVAQPNQKPLA
ncbi:MAG: hypothetical protein KKA76_17915, partial [Proteobacteria bacterium]|nr:hypothetical protein [Pseudomonadota bacterium]